MGDFARARAIFELGVAQTPLSYPENLWKAYIDFEFEQGEREKTRQLYERLVSISGHVKVWRSYAEFEAAPIPLSQALREDEDEEEEEEEKMVEGSIELARQVFDRGYKDLKNRGLKDEVRVATNLKECATLIRIFQRFVLLEAWREFERSHGSQADVDKVQAMFPIVTRKQRKVDEDGDMEEQCTCRLIFRFIAFADTKSAIQIGTWYSPMTNGRQTLHP